MNRCRYFCRNCWDKERKEVIKKWTGGPQENANSASRTWNSKSSLLQALEDVERRAIRVGKSLEAPESHAMNAKWTDIPSGGLNGY